MRWFCSAFALFLFAFLSGCGGRLYIDGEFVGTWRWTGNVRWMYVFYEDGTGWRGDESLPEKIQAFNWGTREGYLVLNHGRGFADDVLAYDFSEGFLSLSGDIGDFDYFKTEPDPRLIGSWVILENYFIEKTLNADGTGLMSGLFEVPGSETAFSWFASGSNLVYLFGPVDQYSMSFDIIGDTLHISGTYDNEPPQVFTRGGFTQNPLIFGEWVWEDDDYWTYSFGQGLFGSRGYAGYEAQFIWSTFDDILILTMLDDISNQVEMWMFSVADGILDLVSASAPNIAFRYFRP